MTPADAQAMFDAGVPLVQVFTGFIFNGPAVIAAINRLTKPRRAP
jgi:dihydroorotate dehydrogenase